MNRLATLLRLLAAFAAMLAVALPLPARADFHTFVIDQLYSNADGSMQYVVLRESQGANGEQRLSAHTLTVTRGSVTRVFTFPVDLPSSSTAGRRVLIASRSFAASAPVAPDYVVPDRFLPADGGTLDYAGVDRLDYPPLPSDGATALARGGARVAAQPANFAGQVATLSGGPVEAVEYYNAALDHYFISPLAPDIEALDSGRFPGWGRTGARFRVQPAAVPGTTPVCRFFIPPEHGNSHFFSASPEECAAVAAAIPVNPWYSGYIEETPQAFFVALPDGATGACPGGTVPVYRLWNARVDSNHRYTTDPQVRDEMSARGYVPEGMGPGRVAMCAVAPVAAQAELRISGPSPFARGCSPEGPGGFEYHDAEVEPWVAVHPGDPSRLVAAWQQDRRSSGGASGLVSASSRDGGRTWTRQFLPFSACGGGNAANGGAFDRASDPWTTIGPDGTAHQIGIAFSGESLTPGSSGAVRAARSPDSGTTWTAPATLLADGADAFSDKESITADPYDARYVYAIWDRLSGNTGPTWFARSTSGGANWEPARPVYDPGEGRQTINNQIVVLPDGTLVLFFTRLINAPARSAALMVMRSADKGTTWSDPILIAQVLTVGTRDPTTGFAIRDASMLGSIAAGRDGTLAVVWQDLRAGENKRDGVLLSRSTDGGRTWSTPIAVNAVSAVPAFVPMVAIRDDGTIGISYYDFRSDTVDPATLPTEYWLAQTRDGATFDERRIAGPFDLATAPVARGYFLGDYQGLVPAGAGFVSVYARTTGDPANRTDIFVSTLADGSTTATATTKARAIATMPLSPDTARAVDDAIRRAIERRLERPGPPR